MGAIEFLDSYYFSTAYYFIFLVLIWSTMLYHVGSSEQKILHSMGSPVQGGALVLTILVTLFLGLRPLSGDFGDMRLYAYSYDGREAGFAPISFGGEWLWYDIGGICKMLGFNLNEYFLFVEVIYMGGMFFCSFMLARKNLWLAMLFFLTAFSCYSYGTNGIRNGAACSVELVALALLADNDSLKRLPAFLLMFCAIGIHRSTLLPSAAAIGTIFWIKDTKTAIRFWIASIALSLVAGTYVEQLIVALGLDDRMTDYSNAQFNETTSSYFSHTGFRWDFLLYSSFPVLMIWYVTRYRKFVDIGYTVFANAYLLCNAFWIMVVRAAFSNRFAYLSWFLYPVVIFYPLLRMNIWKDQDRKTAIILFLYSGFTFFMFFIYYFGTTGFKGFDLYWWR